MARKLFAGAAEDIRGASFFRRPCPIRKPEIRKNPMVANLKGCRKHNAGKLPEGNPASAQDT